MTGNTTEAGGKRTPGPWKVGYWSGQCNKASHKSGRHPGPQGIDGCVYDPVFFDGGRGIGGPEANQMVVSVGYDCLEMSDEDAAFICLAANNHDALVAELAALKASNAALVEALEEATWRMREALARTPKDDLTQRELLTDAIQQSDTTLSRTRSTP